MPEPLHGDALKEAVRRLAADVRRKVDEDQQGVGTFADHALGGLIAELEQLDGAQAWEDHLSGLAERIHHLRLGLQRLQGITSRRAQGRFVDVAARTGQPPGGVHGASDLAYFDLVMSQGAFECLRWKGMPLFKTAFDFSLYSMLLWELRPATIIELGSGSGASAIWLADLAHAFGLGSHVHSLDLKAPVAAHPSVTFLEGDCEAIAGAFDESFLRGAAHPWLVIEDAHVNVAGVLAHFDRFALAGDYVVVEAARASRTTSAPSWHVPPAPTRWTRATPTSSDAT